MPRLLVLGLGNDILTDDAIGLIVAREVGCQLEPDEPIEARSTTEMGLALLDEITGYDGLVLVDAVQTGRAPAGHVHELVVDDLHVLPSVTPHFLGIGETLALGRLLGLPMPERVRILGIEVEKTCGRFDADGTHALFHGIAVAQGDGVAQFGSLPERVEINGEAEGGAGFVLAAVSAADGARVVVEDVHVRAQEVADGAGFFDQFRAVLEQREDAGLDGSDPGMEPEDDPFLEFAFIVGGFVFAIGLADQGKDEAIHAGAGFDDVGDVLLLGLFVEVFHRFAAVLLVLGEIEIAAGGDALEFLGAERELEKDIDGGFGVVGEFLLGLPVFLEGNAGEPDAFVPADALFDPVLVPDLPAPVPLGVGEIEVGVGERGDTAGERADHFIGADEEFEFHLFELAGAEGEIARGDLVPERFPDLGDAEGYFDPGTVDHVLELDENGLGGFGSEISDVLVGTDGADGGIEHEVERAGCGQLATAFAAVGDGIFHRAGGGGEQFGVFQAAPAVELFGHFVGARSVVGLGDEDGDGFVADCVRFGCAGIVDCGPGLRIDLVGAEAFAADFAVGHGIAEGVDVSGGLPDGWMHDDGGVEADDVIALLGHGTPPEILDVAFEFGAERAVIPEAINAAVNFGRLENESPSFAEGYDTFHQFVDLRIGHRRASVLDAVGTVKVSTICFRMRRS
jgi:hydrogenase maturation protease